ncbi:MAG: electron transfer flavoprotein subunit alpha/FixB family protein, partial [Halobacteriales archaeon]
MVLAFVEHEAGTVEETALEQFTLVRELAAETDGAVTAAVFGEESAETADQLSDYGVDAVYHVTHDALDRYAPAAWADSLVQLAEEVGTSTIVAAGSDRGQEVLARAGATLEQPMAANCLEVAPGDVYELTRQRWGGSLKEHARLEADTYLLTTAEHELGLVEADSPTDPTVESFTPDLDDAELAVEVERFEEADVEGVPLGEARVVVSGG